MTTYHVTRQAESDLVSIWEYIAADNPVAADRLIDRIEEKLQMLSRQPLIGEGRNELAPNLRNFPVGNYVIYYRPLESEAVTVEIVRVLHGARDIPGLL